MLTGVTESPLGTEVTGTLTSKANTTFTIEFFANDSNEPSGRTFLGFQKVNPNIWMWRCVSHGGHVYSFGYTRPASNFGGEKAFVRLCRSKDRLKWKTVHLDESRRPFLE